MDRTALFAGSFDPYTNGHHAIVKKASALFDEVIAVSDEDAYEVARLVPKTEGFSVGISAGAALWAAGQLAAREENKGKRIVVIAADSGERYLTSDLYE